MPKSNAARGILLTKFFDDFPRSTDYFFEKNKAFTVEKRLKSLFFKTTKQKIETHFSKHLDSLFFCGICGGVD